MDAASPPVVEMRNISKRFGSFAAIHDASLDIGRGEIHALVGENGAGKSTLMNILYGMFPRSGGEIDFDGRPVAFANPREAILAGVGMVHQHFKLAPTFSVAENIILGSEPMRSMGRIDVKRAEAEAKALSEAFGLDLDPRAVVGSLPVGLRQRVEILKALYRKARVLILDEPTAVLTPQETRELFVNMRALAAQGHSIIFITHKLREVLATADRITVLRRGKVTATMPAAEAGATEAALVALMLGANAQTEAEATTPASQDAPSSAPQDVLPRVSPARDGDETPVLDIRSADVPDPAGRVPLHNISLSINPGEIVGVAAVSGNGQKELGELVQGLRHCHSGSMELLGTGIRRWSPRRTIALGVACLPEDPLREGTVPTMTVLQNMVLPMRQQFAEWGGLSMGWRKARDFVVRALQSFGLRMPALEAPIATLSGGNIQRVVFTREVARQPKLLLSYYPTRGMDVPSANAARDLLRAQRAAGSAILLVSEDLDELLALSDRLVVMHRGQIVGTFRPDEEPSLHDIGILMTGGEHIMTGVQKEVEASNG